MLKTAALLLLVFCLLCFAICLLLVWIDRRGARSIKDSVESLNEISDEQWLEFWAPYDAKREDDAMTGLGEQPTEE